MSWFLEDDQVKAQGEGAILVLVPPGAAPGGWIRTDTDASTGPIDVQIPRGVWPYGYFEVQDPKNPYPVTVRFEVPATVAAGDLVQVPRPAGGWCLSACRRARSPETRPRSRWGELYELSAR